MAKLKILGFMVKDKITGYTGVATSVCYDLYGCVQVVITGPVNEKGEIPDGRWFDFHRLEVVGTEPVMSQPVFDGVIDKGPADKPRFQVGPR